jgi:hypothetical protein
VLADNKLALNAEWDSEILAIELQALIDIDFDVSLTGFSATEIDLSLDRATEASIDAPNNPADARCAIYTRKSSDEGLERSFNSLDAQRDACEAYIASQKHEGWRALPQFYDDGGFSAGRWRDLPSSACWTMLRMGSLTWWSSTRSTALPGPWPTSPS